MFSWDDAQKNYNEVQKGNHASLNSEILAGAAAFVANQEWEEWQRGVGAEASHGEAKRMIDMFATGAVYRLDDTRGGDFIGEASSLVSKKADELYDQYWGGEPSYDPAKKGPHPKIKESFSSDHW